MRGSDGWNGNSVARNSDTGVSRSGKTSHGQLIPELSVVLNFEAVQIKARSLDGRFAKVGGMVHKAHLAMAENVQEAQAKSLKESIAEHGRAQRGTDDLLKALIAEGNRYVSVDGFAVGLQDFLDGGNVASYWREIEHGSDIFTGRVLRGFFKNPGFSGPIPGSRAQSRMPQLNQTTLKNGRLPGYDIVIHNDIPAYEYLKRGGAAWHDSGDMQRQYQLAMASLKGIVKFGSSGHVVGYGE